MNRTKTILILVVILACVGLGLISCNSTAPGPAAQQAALGVQQAEFNYQNVATSEAAATEQALSDQAQQRLNKAYYRSTQIAQAAIQGTQVAQDQAQNAAIIADLQDKVTANAVAIHATATEIVAKATEQANFRTATAIAIQRHIDDDQKASAIGSAWSLLAYVVGAFVGFVLVVGGICLLLWKVYTKNSFIPFSNGTPGGVVVESSPLDPFRHLLGQPARSEQKFSLLMQANDNTPSANPQLPAPYDPLRVSNRGHETIYNKNELTPREKGWDIFRTQVVVNFAKVSYEYASAHGDVNSRKIERWKTLAEFDVSRAYINSRWWSDITDVLQAAGVINKKEQGKETTLKEGGPCRNISDLVILAERGKLLPAAVPAWFQLDESGAADPPDPDVIDQSTTDSAVQALPGIER